MFFAIAVLLGIAIVVAIFALQSQQRDHITENGVTTTAIPVRVDETRIAQDSGPDKRTYRAIFSYVVDGTTYSIMSQELKYKAKADAFLHDPNVSVIYLPQDPSRAILQR